jgi:hypothetical protein
MEYKILETEFDKLGFHFKQLFREGDYAIYEKTKGNSKGFETIRVSRHNGYTIAGVTIEPAETYPNNEQWGVHGFTPWTIEDAYKKLDWMKNKQFKEVKEEKQQETPGLVKRGRGRPRKIKI